MDQLKRFWPCLFIGTIWLWLFWPIISGQQVVGFRDSAYLYYPLFQWIDAQWAEGILPLWNPYCNHGMPVVHDGSSSVFYPGKLVFFLRQLPYPARYGIYIAMHFPIAAAGTYWFARTLRTQQTGATLAAIAYAFSGPILFQTTNVVYLVSASWLPFALCSVWLMFRQMSFKWSIWTAVFCALMILGGDPQMCYHIGLIMVAFGIWKLARERRRNRHIQKQLRDTRPRYIGLKCLLLVSTTVTLTSGFAAIQILPSYAWASQSVRNDFYDPTSRGRSVPRNVFETATLSPNFPGGPDNIQESTLAGIYGKPVEGMHHDHIYQFSQPPWTLMELTWPNASGKPYPINQRWIDGLAGAERMWTPSLYMGCFVFMLAITALNPFSKTRKRAWLARLFLFFAIGSFGWYGPVWLAQELAPNQATLDGIGAPVGGLYWLMVVFLPKYVTFRYPAKLFAIAVLALAVLAGLNLDQLNRRLRSAVLFRLISLMVLASLLLLAISRQLVNSGSPQANLLFGPFDESGCVAAIRWSGLIAILVATSCGVWVWRNRGRSNLRLQFPLLIICAADILFANSWLVPMVKSEVFQGSTPWEELAESDTAHVVFRPPMTEKFEWAESESEDRLAEIVRWQRESLFPKHHLNLRIQLFGSFYSVEPRDSAIEFRPKNSLMIAEDINGNFVTVPDSTRYQREFLSGRGVDSKQPSLRGISAIELDVGAFTSIHQKNENQFIVETDNNYRSFHGAPVTQLTDFTLLLDLPADSGWKVGAVSKRSGNQVRSTLNSESRILEFTLPANDQYTITATYRPQEFYVGAWISVTTWLGVLGMSCFSFARTRRKKSKLFATNSEN